jgi:hypothetical protein
MKTDTEEKRGKGKERRRRNRWITFSIQETVVDANTGDVLDTRAYGLRASSKKELLYDLERSHKAVCVGSSDIDEKGGVWVLSKCMKKTGVKSKECLRPVVIFLEFQEEED